MMATPETMWAMVFEKAKKPLRLENVAVPRPESNQILIQVQACGVCRTDLHIFDGELAEPKLPLIPGHEIVGRVAEVGEKVDNFRVGDRVGVAWLGFACGFCRYCKKDQENLCENARFTGYTVNGGFAEYTVADARFSFHLPPEIPGDAEMAPLMCAGLIGYRSYRMAGKDARNAGALWIWRGGAYPDAGGGVSTAAGLCVYEAGGYEGAGICAATRGDLGRGFGY